MLTGNYSRKYYIPGDPGAVIVGVRLGKSGKIGEMIDLLHLALTNCSWVFKNGIE